MNSAIIEAEALTKIYRLGADRMQALAGVSLEVRLGESCAIVGESGAGKSTFARILSGRIRPTSGSLKVSGRDVVNLSRRDMKAYWSDVQLVGQDPKATFDPRRTAASALREVLRNFDIVQLGQVRERCVYLLETVGLDDSFLARYPHEMSGGQLQRLSIARALAPSPKILLLDEPTSALDSITQQRIAELLLSLEDSLDITCLIICHDLGLAQMLASRIVVMKDGRVIEDIPSDELSSSSNEYVQSLLDAERALGL